MRYEFGILYAYILRVPRSNYLFYNYRTNEPIKEYKGDGGLPYILQQLSDEGWRIVYGILKNPHADNDWTHEVWLQREVREDKP